MNIGLIIESVYRMDFQALDKALTQGVDLNAVDDDGRTPLMHAILASDASVEMVRYLLRNGANPNIADFGQNWTVLHFAARDQKLPLVQILLDAGARVDVEDSFGNTPLWRCVMAADPNPILVQLLLARGSDPRKRNRYGTSPKDVVERSGKLELLKLFGDA
jgi:ankyrin repeat protein